ncbi:MAG: histidine phosphatase family protein [Acidimicrobiales bacterium]|nr:histidine phosphatase family protein [Acidimicrobiales bacterium]MBO0893087.1 histidine phosphatase family protein [Acidimicrobiales bacterium]
MSSPVRRPATLLLLIRHAEQVELLDPDPELSPRGRLQAQLVAGRLAGLGLTAVVSSPLQRAVQTAEAVCDRCELPLQMVNGLEEVQLGPLARAKLKERANQLAEEADRGLRTRRSGVTPSMRWEMLGDAESGDSARSRGLQALATIVEEHRGGVVACISHGGLINAVTYPGHLSQAPGDLWFLPWHTGITTLRDDGNGRMLIGVNDASHLDLGEDPLSVFAHLASRRLAAAKDPG